MRTTAEGRSPAPLRTPPAGRIPVAPGRSSAWRRVSRWGMAATLALVLAAAWTVRNILPFAVIRPSRMERWNQYADRTPASVGLRAEEFWTEAAPGVWLKCWLVRPVDGSAARGTVVLLHGSSSCKESMLGPAQFLATNGFNAILYDSRACGESGGKWATYGFYERSDFSRVLDVASGSEKALGAHRHFRQLLRRLGRVAGDGGRAAGACRHRRMRVSRPPRDHPGPRPALAASPGLGERPGPRPRRTTWQNSTPTSVSPERSAARISGSSRSVLLIHGTADPRIPLAHAERLRAALGASGEWYPVSGGGHNELWRIGGAEYRRRWLGFWERNFGNSPRGG